MKIIRWIIDLIKFIIDEQDDLCPHCGYYCHGKSVFCNQPLKDDK